MGIFKYFRKLSVYNKTVADLNRLTNYELKDIGMSRHDIRKYALQAYNLA